VTFTFGGLGGSMPGILVHSLTVIAGLIATDPRLAVPNELPRGWKMADIAAAALPRDGGRVYVLAWQILQDDRPFRVESCLVVKVSGDRKRFTLTHLYRHPGASDAKWEMSMTHATGGEAGPTGRWYFHATKFDRRPGNKEVYAALKFQEVNWRWEPDHGFRIVACGVCEASWQLVTKEKPTRFFGK
jgi:hypothetical protein